MEDVDDIAIPGFSGVELRVEDFPANLPEPRIKRPPTPDITIHQYSCSSEHSYGSNPLEHGRRVVGMATIASGWRSVIPPVFGCMFINNVYHSPSNTKRSNQYSLGTTAFFPTHCRLLSYRQKRC